MSQRAPKPHRRYVRARGSAIPSGDMLKRMMSLVATMTTIRATARPENQRRLVAKSEWRNSDTTRALVRSRDRWLMPGTAILLYGWTGITLDAPHKPPGLR